MTTEQRPGDDSINSEIEASLNEMQLVEERSSSSDGRATRGTVVSVTAKDVFVELGPRSQGVVALNDFDGEPTVGSTIEVVLRGREDDLLLLSLARSTAAVIATGSMEAGSIIEARVVGQNKGGLELKIGDVDGFMPASHVDLGRIELADYVNKTLTCEVIEFDERRRRATLSRRSILERKRDENFESMASELSLGHLVSGTVRRIESFGAFVEIADGVEGLLHVSNISRKRVNDPNDVLKVGQKLEMAIIKVEEGGRRIGLGMKQLEDNPWDAAEAKYPIGTMVTGKVIRIATFGAFIDIGDGIEGLLHISESGVERGKRINDVLPVGGEVTVRVKSVDPERERIGLSRLDAKDRVIGAENEEAGEEDLEEIRRDESDSRRGTNLGDLLRKALGD